MSNFKFQIGNSSRGFTLIETVIVAGVTIVAGALILGVLANTTGSFYKQSSVVNEGLGSNDALSEFRSDIKETFGVVDTYTPTGGPTYTSSASAMVLKLPAVDSSNNIISAVFDYLVFYTSGDKFKIRTYPDASSKRPKINRILADKLQTVTFQYFDLSSNVVSPSAAKKVRMSLSLKQNVSNGYTTNIATSEGSLRND